MTAEPSERRGRADLHIHTWASDGTMSVLRVLDHVEREGALDVIAITDHERIDAALAARHIAADRGLRTHVVVGEEVSTRGGHLLGLFLERRVPPLKPLQWSIEAIHDQGGIAIPAHPLPPNPMCAQAGALRRLMASDNPAVRPDAIETFNPTAFGRVRHSAVLRLRAELSLPEFGASDAHALAAIGRAWTSFPGLEPDDLRAALLAGETRHHGSFHGSLEQVGVYGGQLAKYARGWRAEFLGRVRRDGTGRDHGYPGGHLKPPRFTPDEEER